MSEPWSQAKAVENITRLTVPAATIQPNREDRLLSSLLKGKYIAASVSPIAGAVVAIPAVIKAYDRRKFTPASLWNMNGDWSSSWTRGSLVSNSDDGPSVGSPLARAVEFLTSPMESVAAPNTVPKPRTKRKITTKSKLPAKMPKAFTLPVALLTGLQQLHTNSDKLPYSIQ